MQLYCILPKGILVSSTGEERNNEGAVHTKGAQGEKTTCENPPTQRKDKKTRHRPRGIQGLRLSRSRERKHKVKSKKNEARQTEPKTTSTSQAEEKAVPDPWKEEGVDISPRLNNTFVLAFKCMNNNKKASKISAPTIAESSADSIESSDEKDPDHMDTASRCILHLPSISVSTLQTNQDAENSSNVLAVSVKRSWLKEKQDAAHRKHSNDEVSDGASLDNLPEIAITVPDTRDDDTLSLTVDEDDEELTAIEARRQERMKQEMDMLIDSVLFKLKDQKVTQELTKTTELTDQASTNDIVESEEEQSREELTSHCTRIVDLQFEAESNLAALVDELDSRCSMFDMESSDFSPAVPFHCAPKSNHHRGDVLEAISGYIADSVKSVQLNRDTDRCKTNGSEAVSHENNGGLYYVKSTDYTTTSRGSQEKENDPGYDLGGYTREASNFQYDTITMDDTFGDLSVASTMDRTYAYELPIAMDYTLNYTFDDTVNDTLEETLEDTFGGYTADTASGTLDPTRVYEHADINEIMRLLKARAARTGLSNDELLERIETEQNSRVTRGESKTLIEV